MTVRCDFGAVTRMNEVVLKKYNDLYYKSNLINKFAIEVERNGEWEAAGEFETGMVKEDDLEHEYHVKLEPPIVTTQVRIIIHDNMVTRNIMGRVGFAADMHSRRADQ